jgi:hypothetical protein
MTLIDCFKSTNIAQRHFVSRMLISAGFSVLFCLVAALAIRFGHLQHTVAYFVAILPAFPIFGALAASAVYLAEEKDEFQRQILLESLLGGIGLTLAGTTVWGYLESFVGAPHLDAIWIYPIFWVATGVSVPFVWMRYR